MEKKDITQPELKRILDDVVAKIGAMELPVGRDALEKYCRLTDHDYDFYRKNNAIPQGYVMTHSVPLFNKFFIMLGAVIMSGAIKGVIHTHSVVEFYRDMPMDGKFTGTIAITGIELKSGKKGEYFSVDMDFTVTDGSGGKFVTDMHKFFLKK